MLTDEKRIRTEDAGFRLLALPPSQSVFFDIETTGFKASSSNVYLIGAAVRQDNEWVIRQWIAQAPSEEGAILRAFDAFLKGKRCVVHFNGDHFDIPYLEEKYAACGLPSPFADLRSVDLFRLLRPLKKALGLTHMNQKSLERFAGLDREDPFDGGELIRVYHRYCRERGGSDLAALLLHNMEDVEGMLYITRMLAYLGAADAAAGGIRVHETPFGLPDLPEGCQALEGCIDLSLPAPVPRRAAVRTDMAALELEGSKGRLTFPVLRGTLRRYFPDYRNYSYLPVEDTAVHNSVAAYMDPAYRCKATADTCYVKASGVFLPQPEPVYEPVLRRVRKDRVCWFPLPENAENDSFAADYARLLLQKLWPFALPALPDV